MGLMALVRSYFKSSILLIFISLFFSCTQNKKNERALKITENEQTDTLSMLLKFENSLFPLPSPYQAASLIKKHNFPYDETLVNSPSKYQNYSTAFKQALNLGIFGTDLSYLNVYERTPESISFLSVIKKLSDQLGITEAFDQTFFISIEKNINNKDSLLSILSKTYQNADYYLKTNDRKNIGALIITGGWIESVYILSKIARTTNNREIINRIGEQKHPLDNLIEVLTPYYYKSAEFSKLIDSLIDLAYEFDGIIYSYSYKEPKIDVQNKRIYINSESRVVISEYHLETISKKVESIRNQIIE